MPLAYALGYVHLFNYMHTTTYGQEIGAISHFLLKLYIIVFMHFSRLWIQVWALGLSPAPRFSKAILWWNKISH